MIVVVHQEVDGGEQDEVCGDDEGEGVDGPEGRVVRLCDPKGLPPIMARMAKARRTKPRRVPGDILRSSGATK